MSKKKIPKKVNAEIKKFVDILRKDNLPISSVFLFGSYAKGKAGKWSDIDLCVVSPKFKNTWDALDYLWQRRPTDTGLTIEPVGLSPKDLKEVSTLSKELKETGIRIF